MAKQGKQNSKTPQPKVATPVSSLSTQKKPHPKSAPPGQSKKKFQPTKADKKLANTPKLAQPLKKNAGSANVGTPGKGKKQNGNVLKNTPLNAKKAATPSGGTGKKSAPSSGKKAVAKGGQKIKKEMFEEAEFDSDSDEQSLDEEELKDFLLSSKIQQGGDDLDDEEESEDEDDSSLMDFESEEGEETNSEDEESSEVELNLKQKTSDKVGTFTTPLTDKKEKVVATKQTKQDAQLVKQEKKNVKAPQKVLKGDDADEEARRIEERNKRTLFVKNIPANATEETVKELSIDIKSVRMRHQPKNKTRNMGYAHLEFLSEEKAEQCFKLLQEKKIGSTTLFVDYVGEKSNDKKSITSSSSKAHKAAGPKTKTEPESINPKKLFVTGFGNGMTLEELTKLFPEASDVSLPVRKRTGKTLGYGFIYFEDEAKAKKAHKAFESYAWKDHELVVVFAKTRDSEPAKPLQPATQKQGSKRPKEEKTENKGPQQAKKKKIDTKPDKKVKPQLEEPEESDSDGSYEDGDSEMEDIDFEDNDDDDDDDASDDESED